MRRRHQGDSAANATAAPCCAWMKRLSSIMIAACFAGRLARQRKSKNVPCPGLFHRDRDEMPPGGLGQRFGAQVASAQSGV